MKNKIKLLLLGVICLLSFIISQTNALTFYGGQNSVNILSSYNGKTLHDPGNGYLSCIIDSYKDSANFDKNLSCSEGSYYMYTPAFMQFLLVDGIGGLSQGNYLARGQIEGSRDIFSLLKLRDGEKTIYSKITMKNLQNKMLNVKSARGENVYDQAFINGLGFVLVLPEREQLRGATVIANSYILDGYVLYAAEGVSYMLDTYENKLYIYNNNFYTYQMQQEGALGIFPKLWNLVPDFVYDINWGIGSDDKMYYTYSDYKTFEKTNRREGTKSDLAELRENLKKSIVILNQEHAEIFLGQTPEELGIGTGTPNTNNQTNTSGSNNASYEERLSEYNSCMSYWRSVKVYANYDRECYRSLLDSAPLTGSYDAKKVLASWYKINEWNGDGELDIGTDDRICLVFKERKTIYKNRRSTRWEEFQATAKENRITPNAINPEENCGKRPERDGIWGKILDTFGKKDNIYEVGGEIIYTGKKESEIFNDYTSMKVACSSIGKMIARGLSFVGVYSSILDCQNFENLTYKEYKEKILLGNNGTGEFNTDGSLYISGWEKITEPFYSGYNSVSFVAPNCGGFKDSEFDIFGYLLFFIIMVYFLRFL